MNVWIWISLEMLILYFLISIFFTHGLVVIGTLQVYASDAYTLPGNTAVLPCLVMVPVEQAWAVQVTHWTVSSGPNNQHLVDSHAIPQREYLKKNK